MYSKELINSVKEMRKIGKKLREISCTKEIPISSVQWILRDRRRTVYFVHLMNTLFYFFAKHIFKIFIHGMYLYNIFCSIIFVVQYRKSNYKKNKGYSKCGNL